MKQQSKSLPETIDSHPYVHTRNLHPILTMKIAAALLLLLSAGCSSARLRPAPASSTPVPDFLAENAPRAELMLLGVFHFADAGLDAYKPKFSVDVMTAERQAEIEDLVARLAAFKPTKVAVEQNRSRQPRLDSLYNAYLAGNYKLPSNEVYQLGFRLAKRLGHSRVYAVDVAPRATLPDSVAKRQMNELGIANVDSAMNADPWTARYRSYYAYNDSVKTTTTLSDHLIYVNDPASVRRMHGHYLVSSFKFARDTNYVGPDDMTRWYNRNLRIFSNIQQITGSPSERILAIIGAGHLPILRFLAGTSPEHRLVEPGTYLRKSR